MLLVLEREEEEEEGGREGRTCKRVREMREEERKGAGGGGGESRYLGAEKAQDVCVLVTGMGFATGVLGPNPSCTPAGCDSGCPPPDKGAMTVHTMGGVRAEDLAPGGSSDPVGEFFSCYSFIY